MTEAKRGSTIESLQAGRAIAALAVVLFHASLAGRDFGGPFIGRAIFQYGYLGVDFFFVLSGFIIYHSTVGRNRTAREFALARFRRVYLPYWPAGVAMALVYTFLPGISAGHPAWSWLPSLTLAPVDAQPALAVAWSLKHEFLFYALFGLFYFSRLLPLGLAAWALSILLVRDHVPFATINLEFFFGIAAAIAYRRHWASPMLFIAAPLLAGLWVVMGSSVDDRILIGAAMAFVVAPLAQLERKSLNVPKPLILLGAASYSLYLIHLPVVSLVARLFSGSWPIFFAAIIAPIPVGFAYHFLIEKRVIRRRTNPEVFQA